MLTPRFVGQPTPFGPLIAPACKLRRLLFADLIDCLAHLLHDVKAVIDKLVRRLGDRLRNGSVERVAYVQSNRADLRPLLQREAIKVFL